MAIGGLWHGAAWTFVLWGLFHGVCLAVNHLWQAAWPADRRDWRLPGWLTSGAGRSLTFLLVVLGWVLFRAANLDAVQHLLAAMFGLGAAPLPGASALLKTKTWIWLAGLLAFVWFMPNTAEVLQEHQPYPALFKNGPVAFGRWSQWRLNSAFACLAALLLGAAVMSLSRSGEFLYYNF
jgi:D-alanyl-lipoteichoic acid acyltransferase DltB (MBOAT superfamily)